MGPDGAGVGRVVLILESGARGGGRQAARLGCRIGQFSCRVGGAGGPQLVVFSWVMAKFQSTLPILPYLRACVACYTYLFGGFLVFRATKLGTLLRRYVIFKI